MSLKNNMRNFLKDISGVSAVETAILFPVLILWMYIMCKENKGLITGL